MKKEKPVMVRLAFYRGKGGLRDKFVRLITRGPYTRVEVAVGHRMATGWACYSADPETGSIRRKIIDFDPELWDVVEIPGVSKTSVQRWFKARTGMGLNWRLYFRLPFWQEGERCGKYAPAEAAAAALGMLCPERYTVNRLHAVLSQT